jgi:transposase InsO family protein
MLESDLILSLTRETRVDFPRMGANKLRIYLKPKFDKMGIDIGRDAYAALLADNHMLVKRKRSKRKTTFSHHRFYKYPNLIRDYTPTAPNQLWVSDITYIEVGYGFIYLSLITDAWSRKIMGWDLSRDLSSAGALRSLRKALSALPAGSSLIHHSDRGTQYCCTEYVKILEKRNVLISMTESGDPLENAIAERVNGILKNEWLDKRRLKSWEDALSYVEKIIDLYNNERPHQSISFLTPEVVHAGGIHVERKWKNYYPQRPTDTNLSFITQSQAITGYGQESVKPCR